MCFASVRVLKEEGSLLAVILLAYMTPVFLGCCVLLCRSCLFVNGLLAVPFRRERLVARQHDVAGDTCLELQSDNSALNVSVQLWD